MSCLANAKPILTKRQIEVLVELRRGKRTKEIAKVLGKKPKTIDDHLQNIFDRLQVSNRVQAWKAAERMGLLPPEPEPE